MMGISLLLLVLAPMVLVDGSPVFTTKPKNKEAFVGSNVIFTWDYYSEQAGVVKKVNFGVAQWQADNSVRHSALIVNNLDSQIVQANMREPAFKDLSSRIKCIRRDKHGKYKARFNISNVSMNDTRTYFCMLVYGPKKKTKTEYVKLSVVDLQINLNASSQYVESWDGHKVKLLCSVRVAPGESVKFTWVRQPDNYTISRGQHIDTRVESLLTIETNSDHKFKTYTCVAKTRKTTKTHDIYIRRLYPPSKPENLKQELVFDKELENSYQKVYWEDPKDNGGAKVIDYVIEYKPQGIDWNKATTKVTNKKEYTKFTLKEGKKYDVQVYGRNKVGQGPPSNIVEIKVGDYMPSVEARSNRGAAVQLRISWFLFVLTGVLSLLVGLKI